MQSNFYDKSSSLSKLDINADTTDSWSTILVKEEEIDNSIMHVVNNSIYIVGRINWYDTYIAKFNTSGTKLWDHIWYGPQREFVSGFVIDSENNLYIAGITDSSYPEYGDIFLLKYNNSGGLLWEKIFNPFGSSECSLISLNLDNNNSLYMSGYNDRPPGYKKEIFLLKLDLLGEIIWNRQFTVNLRPIHIETQIDSDKSIYVYQRDYELNSILIKYNNSGSAQWNNTWQEEISTLGFKIDSNDNIIITGLIEHNNSTVDIWITNSNKSGETINISKSNYPGSLSYYWDNEDNKCYFDEYFNIYICIKFYLSNLAVFKFNSNFKNQWNCSINVPHYGYELRIDKNLNLYYLSDSGGISSYSDNTEIFIVKINSSGNITLNTNWGGSNPDFLHNIAIDYQNNLYMICTSTYDIRWGFYSQQTILVKNPKPNGNPPAIKIKFHLVDYFVFSFMGIMSAISIGIVLSIIKQKSRKD